MIAGLFSVKFLHFRVEEAVRVTIYKRPSWLGAPSQIGLEPPMLPHRFQEIE
jgi:hypothetical protein